MLEENHPDSQHQMAHFLLALQVEVHQDHLDSDLGDLQGVL
jgi:hypothetical protein